MPSRKEFRGVANDMVTSFVSRNNDVGGYWGMGQLYKHARACRTNTLAINMIDGSMKPYSPLFGERIGFFVNRLRGHLHSRNMPESWMHTAKMYVSFYSDEPRGGVFARRTDDVFICVFEISSSGGRTYTATRRGRCWPHNRSIECKSSRA